MIVSYEKTVIIMSFGGTQAPHHQAQHKAAKRRQSSLHTHQTRPNQPPHMQGACLLGCQIGYGHYKRSTVLYRIEQAWQSFHRLHRVLISRALPVRTRFQLWDACIHSVLFYGLSAITLDTHSAHAIRTQVTKQLRMVVRSPAHIHHESHQQFYETHTHTHSHTHTNCLTQLNNSWQLPQSDYSPHNITYPDFSQPSPSLDGSSF